MMRNDADGYSCAMRLACDLDIAFGHLPLISLQVSDYVRRTELQYKTSRMITHNMSSLYHYTVR